ncbi:MAG: S8 family serine peptidase [Kiritimatiellia bacterium]
MPLAAHPAAETQRDALFRWCRITLSDPSEATQALAGLSADPSVESAELVREWRLADVFDPPITGLPDGTTDPAIGQQWHLDSCRIQQAWNHLKSSGLYPGGRRDVVVAVIDSGVDYSHEELAGNMWHNADEIAGNNIDDDQNGFVDDVHGSCVVSDGRSHSGDPIDLHGHGTHVAGIIAAQAFNLLGGAGVAFNVQIMGVRAAQYSGTLTTTDIAEGVLYAVDNGAEVLNMSFGGYARSQMVEDALAVALNVAVLVAAAGNDGLSAWEYPCYPAALPYVHGVMATTPDGKIAWFSNTGYDLGAPGESIYSTLPGNQYAAWSGTSMAAPVVSGIAALMRSYYWQRDIYSSRFLMGGLWAAGMDESGRGTVVNAYRALTELPQPGVRLLENWLFDDTGIDSDNDGDGRADSGETLNVAIEVINRSGLASNVVATLRARADGAAFDDPYVTILTNTVSFGSIGPFNLADNGFIYDVGGVICGVQRPFVFHISENCPNDHVIAFELTFTFRDGWDSENTSEYTRVDRFTIIVQRGRNLPNVIAAGTTLTLDASDYWIVGGPVLVESNAVLRITEGSQVQWGAISSDPYNPGPQTGSLLVRGTLHVQGSATNPVALFPSYLVNGQTTLITAESGSSCDFSYVTVKNPQLTGIRTLDHGRLDWDALSSTIDIAYASHTAFGKFRGGGTLSVGRCETCLFDAGWLVPSGLIRNNCVFLQDNENNKPLSVAAPLSFKNPLTNDKQDQPFWGTPMFTNGVTYVLLPMENTSLRLAETIANFYGGHVASIRSLEESNLLKTYVSGAANFRAYGSGNHDYVYIGLSDKQIPGDYDWLDGTPLDFTDWAAGYPAVLNPKTEHVVQFYDVYDNGAIKIWGWRNVDQTPSSRYGNGTVASWKSFLLRLPGEWSLDQLLVAQTNGQLLAHVRQNFEPYWTFNAFLNKYWDPAVSRWMRITGTASTSTGYCTVNSNYWGTANTALIDHMIVDYYDNFTSARVDYGTVFSSGYTSTYPFAESVWIGGVRADTVPVVSAGRTDFTVTFNRDMDTSVQPFVTFGPTPPHTDFSVLPRNDDFQVISNGWLNTRTWQGAVWITPVTGEGYHQMRISGAVAADDPWLTSGYDVGRFRFQVRTMGVTAMTLQAQGLEGAIRLSWQQDDFTLLAGYNLYRASTPTGTYERLNSTIIPVGQETYLDTDVVPAVPRYYKFTVVASDLTESDFSNTAAAAALDTVAPLIAHTPVQTASPEQGLRLTATATDNVRVTGVSVWFRAIGLSTWTTLACVNTSSNNWTVTLPGESVQPPGLEYYLVASDGISLAYNGTPALPHSVLVSNDPAIGSVSPNHGPAAGGTQVTLAGRMFVPGLSVLFGGQLASNVVLFNDSQLTCMTPAHYPALVDVTVVNTNGTQTTLLNAFRFEDTGVVVSLPNITEDRGTFVDVTLSASNVSGLRSVDVTVNFESSVVVVQSVQLGTLTAGWSLAANLNTPGKAILSIASATAITGSGSLAVFRLNVVGQPNTSTPLTISSVSLNDGALSASPSDGLFTVRGFFSISGKVNYFSGGQVVPSTVLNLVGAAHYGAYAHSNGVFTVTNVPTGSYTLTPSQTNYVREITAYDASLVLQASAGLITLSSSEQSAADVNRSGFVSAMDASYILEKAVGLIEGPFPGAGKMWDFLPSQRTYSLLNTNEVDQNFTAVLLGDVSGNWTPDDGQLLLSTSSPNLTESSLANAIIATDCGPVGGQDLLARVLLAASQAEVYGVDMCLTYDPHSLAVASVRAGNAAGGFALASNTNEAGIIKVSLAGASPLAGSGPLIEVLFNGLGQAVLSVQEAHVNEALVSVSIASDLKAFDADGDGLIDADETALFFTNPNLADTDGDRMQDGDEIQAGTQPLDRESVFTITRCIVVSENGCPLISWSSVPGMRYQLEAKDSLISPTWLPVGPVVEAISETLSVQDLTALTSTPRFYRVRLAD